MKSELPKLIHEDMVPTRNYIQEVAHVLSALQRALVKRDPHDWRYGLEVGPRGLLTQPLKIGSKEVRASLDLVRHKVRLEGNAWPLRDYAAPEILKHIQMWLQGQKVNALISQPEFASGVRHFDRHQADLYAEALWWMDGQFRVLKSSLKGGLTSPVLLYPHHFDLSLVWFPHDDERQLAVGFSTGDQTIAEPYLYLTAYPEPAGFTKLDIPKGTFWQTAGFSGAILPYAVLSASADPKALFREYAHGIMSATRPLIG
jgi:hypothetical protein